MKFNLPKNSGMLPTDQHRAMKNYRLMQWAKVATFGLYMVAVFMLYVSDVWGVASFVTQNSNEGIALVTFSAISFVLAFFLASSKEAVYEDIALHRSEGWKLKPTQYAAMGLFLSSGLLFEMFSTTNNQQHIANTAAEQSSMMKSIQGTDVSLLGSANLTDSFASAKMKLAQCEARLAQGKEKHCDGAKARVDAVRESMTMSNQLATTAAQQSVDNKVDGMLKIREHFDKPMFQAIGKATGTDNNSGMLMVIGVLIFIFELQHIMALFAYANSLARINRKLGNVGSTGESDQPDHATPAPLSDAQPKTGNKPPELMELPNDLHWAARQSAKNWEANGKAMGITKDGNISYASTLAPLANSAKQTVAEYAEKVEHGLKASPEIIAREYARADYANKQVMADAGAMAKKEGDKLGDAMNPKVRFFKLILAEAQARVNHGLAPTPENLRGVVDFVIDSTSRATGKEIGVNNADRDILAGMVAKHLQKSGVLYPPAPLMETDRFKQSPEQRAWVLSEHQKRTEEYERDLKKHSALSGASTIAYLAPEEPSRMSVTTVPVQPKQTPHDVQTEQPVHAVTTVPVQSEQHETAELTGAAKQAETVLYPQWLALVQSKEMTAGARDSKRFISQATKNGTDEYGLTIQEMQRIWASWQDRAAHDGVLKANPKYQPNNRQPKYLLAA